MSKKASNVITLDAAAESYNNESMSRTSRWFNRIGAMLGVSQEGRRDVYQIYGYPPDLGGNYGFEKMYQYANRQGVANRITHGVAKACWRDGFEIRTDPEDEETVVLADEIKALNSRGFISKLERTDALGRMGRFSVLLVGVPDGRDLNEPVGPVVNGANSLDMLYFQPYAYDSVDIKTWETDQQNPRYGLPLLYTLQRQPRTNNEKDNSRLTALTVHYTRLVHLVENALDSDVEGIGALEPVFNRILDLEKATGGSSEAYFRNARGKIGYEIDKDFAATLLSDPEAKAKFDEGAKRYTDEWQDHTMAAGATLKSLATPHYSPLDTIKVSMWEISSYTGIPIRVLTGEGSGQLAGSEDQLAYNNIIGDRQRGVCIPFIFQVFDILQDARMLAYDSAWSIVFPPQRASTEAQQADVDNKKADTFGKVTSGLASLGGDAIVAESVFQAVGLSEIKVDEIPLDVGTEEEEPTAPGLEPDGV